MTTAPTITLEWIRQEKAKHKAALADLDAVERVLIAQAKEAPETPAKVPLKAVLEGYGAKKRILLGVIADAKPNGLTTQGVISAATKVGLENLKTENVSPQLSAYKSGQLLELRDGLWHITIQGLKFLSDEEDKKNWRRF
jgi:hypothetical protein